MMGKKRKFNESFENSEKKLKEKKKEEVSKSNKEKMKSVFEQAVKKAGFILKYNNGQNELDVDQAIFQRDLTKHLKLHNKYPEIINEFLNTAKIYFENITNLKWSLLPTVSTEICNSARGASQDSLIHLLLGIDILQENLAFFLLEKMAELATCESIGLLENQEDDLNLPHMILCQFRWLDTLTCSKEIFDKMFELLNITPLNAQKEIISYLPDIINDQDHPEIARKLSNLLTETRELNATILDTLGNLNIKSQEISEVRQVVIKTLPSADVQDLPVITKFILQSIGPQDAFDTILELRYNLELESLQPILSEYSKAQSSLDFVLLDTIRSSMRFQKFISDAWIKVIHSLDQTEKYKVLDFLVLLVLHSLAIHRKPIESLMRNKIRAGLFTEDLLNASFIYTAAVREYFGSLLILAETFIRGTDISVSQFGSFLYQKAFVCFDTYCKQEVIGNLVSHIGSGTTNEINTSLDTLVCLVKEYTEEMSFFGCFIKSILDYLHNLSLQQIRKVYTILSILAYQGNQEGMFLQDDLHIIIRKQLSNTNSKYRRMGIIGALMCVKAMTNSSLEAASSNGTDFVDSDTTFTTKKQKQAISLLELVQKNTYQSPEAFALFCDELSRIIMKGELDNNVKIWISKSITSDFYKKFIVELDDVQLEYNNLNLELGYGLDRDSSDIVLNLMPVILNYKKKEYCPSDANIFPIILSPLFRLLQICEQSKIEDSYINKLQELLSCPVSLPHKNELKEFSKLSIEMKHSICDAMFFCLNWFRELVNAFATTENRQLKYKVIKRLKDIFDLQNILQKLLWETPGYVPIQANFDIDIGNLAHINFPTGINSKRKKKSVPKKKKGKIKNDDREETKQSQSQIMNNEDQEENIEDKNKNSVSLSVFAIFFRELDFDVFILLQNGLNIHGLMESDSEQNLYLNPSELCFLLEDLNQKLSHIFQASNQLSFVKGVNEKKNCFSNLNIYTTTEIIKNVIQLLPAICDIFEVLCINFQINTEGNDETVHGLEMQTDLSNTMAHCSKLILQALNTLLSWNGFTGTNRSMLHDIMKVLASKSIDISVSTLGFQDAAKNAFQYFEKFSNSLSNLECSTLLIKVLETISVHLNDDDDTRNKLGQKAEAYLRQNWSTKTGQKLKGAKINDQIRTLLKIYFKCAPNLIKELETISIKAVSQLIESESKDASSSDFPTLNKSTFSVYYQMMYHHLCEDVKDYFTVNKNIKENQESNLKQWLVLVKIFHVLVNLIKVFDGKLNIAYTLKYGRQFVDMFLKLGMPLLDDVFRSHCSEVQNLLKTLQLSNRFLQHVCSHSKVTKDIILTKQVPPMKRTLESFVYRVKAMLALNKCKDAFWLGNLKNRDLQGVEILSQTSQNESDEDINEIMADDESDVDLEEIPPSNQEMEFSASF